MEVGSLSKKPNVGPIPPEWDEWGPTYGRPGRQPSAYSDFTKNYHCSYDASVNGRPISVVLWNQPETGRWRITAVWGQVQLATARHLFEDEGQHHEGEARDAAVRFVMASLSQLADDATKTAFIVSQKFPRK